MVFDWSWAPGSVPTDLSNIVAIAAGANYSLALRGDGTVAAWGDNSHGQLNVPAGLTNVVAISARGSAFSNLALRSDGTVVGWPSTPFDIFIAGLSVSALATGAGTDKGLVVLSNGTAIAWRDNTYGQANVPSGLGTVVAGAVANDHSLLLISDGSLVAWGSNIDPLTQVIFPGSADQFLGQATVPAGLAHVAAIAAGQGVNAVIVNVVPRITSLTFSDNSPAIRFRSMSGHTYSVEYSPDLSIGSWSPVSGGLVLGNDRDTTVIDHDAANSDIARYYRLRLLQ